jgi:hypothetical protein
MQMDFGDYELMEESGRGGQQSGREQTKHQR